MPDAGINVDAKEVLGKSGCVNTKHQGPPRRPTETIIIDRRESGRVGATGSAGGENKMLNPSFLNQTGDRKKK